VKRYYSGYLVGDYALFPPAPYKGKGWTICFEDRPSDQASAHQTWIEGKWYPAKAVNICASSPERADDVGDMIYASVCLMLGQLPPCGRTAVIPADLHNAEQEDGQDQAPGTTRDVLVGSLPLACLIAAKASYSKAYQYALFKHLLSHQIFSTSTAGLRPSGWWSRQLVFKSREHHVHCAYAIVLAYSVLEELSVHIRADKDKPSTIDGEWNPEVKQELETRLKRAGIDLSESFLWIQRDTPTRIERTRPPRTQSLAEWAGLKVRDHELALVDAIAYTSWLRSRVSAHKLGQVAASLSYYDVLNAQHVARRLLLEKLGFWRYQERIAERRSG